jgi:hypothetical protein
MIVGSFDIIIPATATGENLVVMDHGQFPDRAVGPMTHSRQSIARMHRMRKIDSMR